MQSLFYSLYLVLSHLLNVKQLMQSLLVVLLCQAWLHHTRGHLELAWLRSSINQLESLLTNQNTNLRSRVLGQHLVLVRMQLGGRRIKLHHITVAGVPGVGGLENALLDALQLSLRREWNNICSQRLK